jgi:hypothetical protein
MDASKRRSTSSIPTHVLAHLPVRFFGISTVERANMIRMPSQGQLAIVDDAVVAPIENQNKDSISVFVPASSAQ